MLSYVTEWKKEVEKHAVTGLKSHPGISEELGFESDSGARALAIGLISRLIDFFLKVGYAAF